MTKRNEPTRITIANLEREVRNLTQRCADLMAARDSETSRRIETMTQRDAFSRKCNDLQNDVDNFRVEYRHLSDQHQYNCGYIARVKETDDAYTAGD